MGVSQMPVRDALSRLAAEGAVAIRSKRKIEVPAMTAERFGDLLGCRLMLEPEAAVLALPHITAAKLRQLREIDAALDRSMAHGDVLAYMENNFAFHFNIYRANDRPILNRLIEALWLQFGPFMRVVYGRFGTANLVDQHRVALDAIEAGDAEALRRAIASDIADGMGLIGRSNWAGG
jgi:DNA-binding GntR family transcriptional regulator